MPKVSIITTTYQHEKFIKTTIDSVLSQSFTHWELLIGDDSPDDATWDIIQTYTEKYPEKIRAWHHTQNKGIVENMNFLISQVAESSQYITFLEGDDLYTADCLGKKVTIFEKYPEVSLVYSDMDFIDEHGKVTRKNHMQSQRTYFYINQRIPVEEYILSKNPLIISYSTVAIKKETLRQFLPIQNLSGSKTYSVSDYDLFFRISKEHQVYGIRESLTKYRRHSTNLSSGYLRLFDDLRALIDSYYTHGLIGKNTFQKKQSWIHILKSLGNLDVQNKQGACRELTLSLRSHFLYAMVHKIFLFILLLLPIPVSTFILKKITRR